MKQINFTGIEICVILLLTILTHSKSLLLINKYVYIYCIKNQRRLEEKFNYLFPITNT